MYVVAASSNKVHQNDVVLQAFATGFGVEVQQDPSLADIPPHATLVTFGVSCPNIRNLIKAHRARGGHWLETNNPWIKENNALARFALNGLYPKRLPQLPETSPNPNANPNPTGHILILPPTESVADFVGINATEWLENVLARCKGHTTIIRRHPNDPLADPTQPADVTEHIVGARAVVGFNSAVLVDECIKLGIPPVGDRLGSIIGTLRPFEPTRTRALSPRETQLLQTDLRKCQASLAEIMTPGHIHTMLNFQRHASSRQTQHRLTQLSGR